MLSMHIKEKEKISVTSECKQIVVPVKRRMHVILTRKKSNIESVINQYFKLDLAIDKKHAEINNSKDKKEYCKIDYLKK